MVALGTTYFTQHRKESRDVSMAKKVHYIHKLKKGFGVNQHQPMFHKTVKGLPIVTTKVRLKPKKKMVRH